MANAIISSASSSGIGYSYSSRSLAALPNFNVSFAELPSLMRTRTVRPGAAAR